MYRKTPWNNHASVITIILIYLRWQTEWFCSGSMGTHVDSSTKYQKQTDWLCIFFQNLSSLTVKSSHCWSKRRICSTLSKCHLTNCYQNEIQTACFTFLAAVRLQHLPWLQLERVAVDRWAQQLFVIHANPFKRHTAGPPEIHRAYYPAQWTERWLQLERVAVDRWAQQLFVIHANPFKRHTAGSLGIHTAYYPAQWTGMVCQSSMHWHYTSFWA